MGEGGWGKMEGGGGSMKIPGVEIKQPTWVWKVHV